MEIRNSGKIAIGVIAAMGTIGALHMFIFRQRAAEYQAAKSAYQDTQTALASQGTAPRLEDIDRFKYESLRFKLKFWQNIATLKLGFPDYVVNDSNVFTLARQRQIYWDLLTELEKRRDDGEQGKGPELRFLAPSENATTWNFVKSLPKKYDTVVAVDDDLAKLRNENRLLKSLTVGTVAYGNREQQYLVLLRDLGLNVIQRDGRMVTTQLGTVPDGNGIADRFGRAAATMMTINRIDLIMKKLQPDFFAGKTEAEKRDEMYELFRIPWPKDFSGSENNPMTQRQNEALLNVIEIARQEKIDSVFQVKYFPPSALNYIDPVKAAEAAAAPAPQAALSASAFFDESAMMGMDGGKGGGFGAPAVAATPAGELVGVTTAMEIGVQGSNAAVMSFLYRLTHEEFPYEVDQLRLAIAAKKNPNEESKVQALFYLNVVAYPVFLGSMREYDVLRKVNETEIELAKIAVKPGAREAALRDGVITMDGISPKLVNAPPSPFPSPTASPVPTPSPIPTPSPVVARPAMGIFGGEPGADPASMMQ